MNQLTSTRSLWPDLRKMRNLQLSSESSTRMPKLIPRIGMMQNRTDAKKQKLQTRKYPCPLADKLGCTWMSKLFFDSKTYSRIHHPPVQARQAAEQESSLLLPWLSCFKQGLLCNINNTRGECSNCIESNQSIKSRIYYPCTPRGLASQEPTQSNELDLLIDELPGSDAELSQNGFV